MERLKVGDKVVMNGKYVEGRQEQNAGKIFTVKSTPYFIGGTTCVLLEGRRDAYAIDGLDKIGEERQQVDDAHEAFWKSIQMKQDEKDEMFNHGIFNDIAIGYGKIAAKRLGLIGASICAFEDEMKKAMDQYDAAYARKIYNRIG